MGKRAALDQIFETLRAGERPEAQILELSRQLETADTTWLMEYVGELSGPDDFFEEEDWDGSSDGGTEVKVKGFFDFIDLVSALVLGMGGDAVAEAKRFDGRQSHYTEWVIKYCTDDRFVKQLRQNFPFLCI